MWIRACEIWYKLIGYGRLVVVCVMLAMAPAVSVLAAQPEHAPVAGEESHAEAESHEGGLLDVVARLINFGILVGGLTYLLRGPLTKYLGDRHTQLRSDLVTAAQMRKAANEQLAQIERRVAALPAELETLRTEGAAEIAAEEARIAAVAKSERERLLEQTRRELDLQVRIATRELRAHAAELATGIATARIRESITAADQDRLLDRYLAQLDEPGRGADTKVVQ